MCACTHPRGASWRSEKRKTREKKEGKKEREEKNKNPTLHFEFV